MGVPGSSDGGMSAERGDEAGLTVTQSFCPVALLPAERCALRSRRNVRMAAIRRAVSSTVAAGLRRLRRVRV